MVTDRQRVYQDPLSIVSEAKRAAKKINPSKVEGSGENYLPNVILKTERNKSSAHFAEDTRVADSTLSETLSDPKVLRKLIQEHFKRGGTAEELLQFAEGIIPNYTFPLFFAASDVNITFLLDNALNPLSLWYVDTISQNLDKHLEYLKAHDHQDTINSLAIFYFLLQKFSDQDPNQKENQQLFRAFVDYSELPKVVIESIVSAGEINFNQPASVHKDHWQKVLRCWAYYQGIHQAPQIRLSTAEQSLVTKLKPSISTIPDQQIYKEVSKKGGEPQDYELAKVLVS